MGKTLNQLLFLILELFVSHSSTIIYPDTICTDSPSILLDVPF